MGSVVKWGRCLFAAAFIGFGVLHFVFTRSGRPAPGIIPWLPDSTIPWMAYITGAAFLAVGICIALNKRARLAALFLGILLLLFALSLELPRVIENPLNVSLRTVLFEVLAFCGAALILSGTQTSGSSSFGLGKRRASSFTLFGRYIFAISLLVFGIDHYISRARVSSLVPAWIPGSGMFWTYFTGIAFIAAGMSIATGILARWGAFMIGLMFLLWFLVLHSPRVVKLPAFHNPAEWSSAFIALGMCGASWIVAWYFVD
ncbi:MAG TPA: hypothetical protein VGZ48_06140 [Candidatus Acidoferrales bacterium]|jgi:uncharacterized membrane protein|nr:hypothetical protein [Candidatus Acidoferrales bacterium]